MRPRAVILCQRFFNALATLIQQRWPPLRVAYLIGKVPWMTVAPGTYIGRMLAQIGWHQLTLPPLRRYPEVQLDAFVSEVDAILLPSEPYRFGV